MSEGELKKQIIQSGNSYYEFQLYFEKQLNQAFEKELKDGKIKFNSTMEDTLVSIGEVLMIIDEAKKEFPEVPQNHPEELIPEDYWLELAKDREKWFLEWFGDTE